MAFRLLLVFISLLIVGCSEDLDELSFNGQIMGTTYSVKLVEGGAVDFNDQALHEKAKQRVQEALSGVDQALSTYKQDSELMQFNLSPVGSILVMGKEMREVTLLSLEILEASDGFFDPSIGPLVKAWGFGAGSSKSQPDEQELKRFLAQTGMRSLELIEGNRVRKAGEGFVDYSAIAKGYGVDRAAASLRVLGFQNFMVEVGGEVRVSGHNALGGPWRLGIEQPDFLERKAYNIVHISNVSMATSGDYRNFIDGPHGRYSHTINPQTGYPVSNDVASVSVIMDDCASADAWATALLAMGKDKALELSERLEIAAYFIVREEDGFSSYLTENMRKYVH